MICTLYASYEAELFCCVTFVGNKWVDPNMGSKKYIQRK